MGANNRSLFGALKGTVEIDPGVDLTEPTGEVWEAAEPEEGVAHSPPEGETGSGRADKTDGADAA